MKHTNEIAFLGFLIIMMNFAGDKDLANLKSPIKILGDLRSDEEKWKKETWKTVVHELANAFNDYHILSNQ